MNPHIEEILETYPNLFNDDYVVDCTWEEEEHTKIAPFVRVLPRHFAVKDVTYLTKRDGCYFRVRYNFENGDDLPTGPGLKVLFDQMKKYFPSNTTIVADWVELPKYIVIEYAVFCRCPRMDFERPIHPSKVWAMQNALENFHV